ncbi:unnamed protein product [Schistosoma haematobium]|nr:unnamed protein product [Schistosoma haematobium]
MADILNSCQSLFLEKSNVLNKHTTCIFIDLLNVLIHLRLLNISDLAINGNCISLIIFLIICCCNIWKNVNMINDLFLRLKKSKNMNEECKDTDHQRRHT